MKRRRGGLQDNPHTAQELQEKQQTGALVITSTGMVVKT